MSGDHNQYQKDKSYLDFECPRCGHCCQAKGEEHMSTSFNPEWLQPGAVVPVDIPTLAAFAEELRRVNQENQALRETLEKLVELLRKVANDD